jgi:hypothetical protein
MNDQTVDDPDGCDGVLFGAALCIAIVLLGYGLIVFIIERVCG